MSTQTWTVDDDGLTREILAESEPERGRIFIRVDGRMAARPMAANEDERRFTVGSTAYVVRRTPFDELDLDIAPPEFQPPRPLPAARVGARTAAGTTRLPEGKAKSGVPVFKIIAAVIGVVLLGAGIRYGKRALRYMHVPWKTYTSRDRSFRANFAGDPKKSFQIIGTTAGLLNAIKLESRYEDHFYNLEFVTLPGEIPIDNEGALQESILSQMMKKQGWKLIQHDYAGPALTFIAEIPESKEFSEGTMRGKILIHKKRIYIMYAFVPRGESISWDVGEYLRSLELPD